ncbi:MAG: radical SAM family heme chaperone HemW [Lachnospiraceae bacterium]|nr:radical SAM family heme chaperone HemW [Lachnospiraceae bacterium]
MRPLAVYVHIPFCVKKCAYCDFLSFPPEALPAGSEETKRRYFSALLAETDHAAQELRSGRTAAGTESCQPADGFEIRSIYFGGGTPSLADAEEIAGVIARLRRHFPVAPDAEISMECNPGTVSVDKLRALRETGINRLSIGVQSFDDTELTLLGRIHTAAGAERCFRDARAAGFDNVNLDLMAALPGQTAEALLCNVERAVSLSPEHISLYSLIIEPGTPFFSRYGEEVSDPHAAPRSERTQPHLPDEDAEREMVHAAWSRLEEAGYHRYEISNFARGNLRCRQNLVYWERGEYLGLGLGAASLLDETRFSNTRDLKLYLDAFADRAAASDANADTGMIRENIERLDEPARMEEFMFLGLRLTEGVQEQRFADTFHREIDSVYGETLRKLVREGLISRRDGRIFLTPYGTDIANYVMAAFLF